MAEQKCLKCGCNLRLVRGTWMRRATINGGVRVLIPHYYPCK